MKMYVFCLSGNPNLSQFHVVAETKDDALKYVENFVKNEDLGRLKKHLSMFCEDPYLNGQGDIIFPVSYTTPNGVKWNYKDENDYFNSGHGIYQSEFIYYTNNTNYILEYTNGYVSYSILD